MPVTWKSIPGFSLFEASNKGQIRRVAYPVFTKGPRHALPHVLRGYLSNRGYWTVSIPQDGRAYGRHLVHRLVCLAFNGDAPLGKDIVCHRDGDRRNNRPSNLYWGDRQDNAADALRLGELPSPHTYANGHPTAKLSEDNVRHIKRRLGDGETIRAIADSHGVSRSTIAAISAGNNWAWVAA